MKFGFAQLAVACPTASNDWTWPVAAPYLNQTSKSDRIRLPRCHSSQQRQSCQRPAGSTSAAPPPAGVGMPRPSTLGEVTGNALFNGVVGAAAGAVAAFGVEEAGAAAGGEAGAAFPNPN